MYSVPQLFLACLMCSSCTKAANQPNLPNEPTPEYHTVVRGDTMWKISRRYGLSLDELIALNPQIENPNLIFPGQKINLRSAPTPGGFAEQVVGLVNSERAARGLDALKINQKVMEVAQVKAEDMRDNNYFDHNSPTYGSPFEMLKYFGVNFQAAAENIAQGQRTPEAVVASWMNSSGHRANILSPTYTETGVGFANGNMPYWAQIFIKP